MQRYFSDKLKDNKFELRNDDVYHITRVMRMKSGDNIEIVCDEKVYLCCIDFVNGNLEVNVVKCYEKTDEKIIEKVLIIPLLKEPKMDLILQKATELGVNKIIPVEMERSIIKLNKEKEDKKLERWMRIVKEASEQSMRVNIPIITEVKKMSELENETGLKLVCSTKEKENTIKMFLQSHKSYDKISIVIGPEGGISPKEEEYLNNIGFKSISLGKNIMRVETVPLYILSVLNYENME